MLKRYWPTGMRTKQRCCWRRSQRTQLQNTKSSHSILNGSETPKTRPRDSEEAEPRNQEVQSLHFDMVDALYQRAELIPSVPGIWEEHTEYLIERKKTQVY